MKFIISNKIKLFICIFIFFVLMICLNPEVNANMFFAQETDNPVTNITMKVGETLELPLRKWSSDLNSYSGYSFTSSDNNIVAVNNKQNAYYLNVAVINAVNPGSAVITGSFKAGFSTQSTTVTITVTGEEEKSDIRAQYESINMNKYKEMYENKSYQNYDIEALKSLSEEIKADAKIIKQYREEFDTAYPKVIYPDLTSDMSDAKREEELEKYRKKNDAREDEHKEVVENGQLLKKLLTKVNDKINSIIYETDTEQSIGDIWDIAQDFLNPTATTVSVNNITNAVVSIGSLMITIAALIFPILTIIMGIRFVTSDAEGKGKLKTQLVGLLISTCVTFGAFIVWRVAYSIMNSMIK